MLYGTLLKANLKQHRAGLSGIFFLTLLVAAALGTALGELIFGAKCSGQDSEI